MDLKLVEGTVSFLHKEMDWSQLSAPIECSNPSAGFIRYLWQLKKDAPYMGSDMSKSFVFCVPGGHGEFIVLPQDPSEREKLMQDICPSDGMSGSYEYSMALVDVDFSWPHSLDCCVAIAENPRIEFSEALHSSVMERLRGTDYECYLGVFHGKQKVDEDHCRTPHFHILLRRIKSV